MDAEQARGIYQLLTLSAWADGQIDPAETRVAEEFVAQIPELSPVAGALAAEAKALVDRLGIDAALSQIASHVLDPEVRELAFLYCARLIEADGKIARAEFGVLLRLRALFALDDEAVARLLTLAGQS